MDQLPYSLQSAMFNWHSLRESRYTRRTRVRFFLSSGIFAYFIIDWHRVILVTNLLYHMYITGRTTSNNLSPDIHIFNYTLIPGYTFYKSMLKYVFINTKYLSPVLISLFFEKNINRGRAGVKSINLRKIDLYRFNKKPI